MMLNALGTHCAQLYSTGGELSVALTRQQVTVCTCGSKPGVGGIFFLLWPFSNS